MTILTDAGKDAVDQLSSTVEEIEEQVRERIEDAINALDRYDVDIDDDGDSGMSVGRSGDWLSREAVLDACKRGAW